MYRTFAASILAAVTMARGTGDGGSKANASEVQLVDTDNVTNTLYTYNGKDNNKDALFVELHLVVKSNSPPKSNIEYGFCVEHDTA